MTVRSSQFLTIFKKLNTKIVIYFISFAFLPLLIFSILGYYLNKDLITEINYKHLHSLNTATANEIELYLQSKNRILMQAFKDFENSEKTGSLQSFFYEREGLNSDFLKIEVQTYPEESPLEQYIKSRLESKPDPGLVVVIRDILIIGYLSRNEIGELLNSNVKEIQNSVYFLNSEKKLFGGDYKSIEKQEIKHLEEIRSEQDIEKRSALFDDDQYLSSSTFLEVHNVYISTHIKVKSFYGELTSFRNKILLANLAIALILITLAIVFSRHLTTPIHKLIEAFFLKLNDIGKDPSKSNR